MTYTPEQLRDFAERVGETTVIGHKVREIIRAHAATLEELNVATIDAANYRAKYDAMRERVERLESELARLKAPVEVAGIVERLRAVELEYPIHTTLEGKAAAALESLAAKVKALEEEIAKLKGLAEAMAVEIRASYWGGNPSTALAAYRLDYPEES